MYAIIKHIEIKHQECFHNQQLDNCYNFLSGQICWHCIFIYTFIYIEKKILRLIAMKLMHQLKVIIRLILNTIRYLFQK